MIVVDAQTELEKLIANRHRVLRKISKIEKNPVPKWHILCLYFWIRMIFLKSQAEYMYVQIIELKDHIRGVKKR